MKNELSRIIRHASLLILAFLSTLSLGLSVHAQGTAFTYQGRLNNTGVPANGSYDFRFRLAADLLGNTYVGSPLAASRLAVSNGLFTATLDFGTDIFTGSSYWLEVDVRTNGTGSYTTLTPLQPLTPAPYAIFANSASNVSGTVSSAQLTGQIANGNLPVNPTFSGTVTATGFGGNGAGLTALNASQLSSGAVPDARLGQNIARTNQVWAIGGNGGTTNDFIGTTDDTTFNIRVNNVRVMRYRMGTDIFGLYTNAPNVIGGSPINSAPTTVVGVTIAGGGGNSASDGTPSPNQVTASFGTVGGGSGNTADGGATVAGGFNNTASGGSASLAGGANNTAGGGFASVAGGFHNTAGGDYATLAGGRDNTASGNYSTVAGGYDNIASGDYSFAGGRNARADDFGSFVWADATFPNFHSGVTNQFAVRCTGGAKFVTGIDPSGNQTAGVRLQAGDTAWSSISDRNQKKNFATVDGRAVLEKVARIPVQFWNYRWESDTNTPHLGPMAQDFKTAFYPGRDDKSISTLEFDGVELAAIQGLNQKVEAGNAGLRNELKRLSAESACLKERLETLERIVLSRDSN